ncbi:helix-turn-helix domain-containing protein [Streptosporangium sp. 'caverna']|uniref:helix-turn-helix domain-containing protein n=1 Tax=Streptosporangium sp. 'caverna' TaxID=2202249 RepID=UPI0013A6E4D9|nr:helix-turn-helix domain-containing protein [Streptosporangium sp. 'caverna']
MKLATRTNDAAALARILRYVSRQVADPELNPRHIARAHHISLRTLYRLCEQGGLSLEQWIIDQRLENVRCDLSRSARDHHSVEAVARSWGFSNPTFFSRRFRLAYGLTAGQWRRRAHELPAK